MLWLSQGWGQKILTYNKLDALPDPDYVEEFEKITKKGLALKIRLSLLKGYICGLCNVGYTNKFY